MKFIKPLILIFSFLFLSNFSYSVELTYEQKRASENLAKDIANCAGDFAFAAELFSQAMPAHAEKLRGLSRGWYLGSWAPYYFAGYEMEAVKIFAEGKKDTKFNEWLVRFENPGDKKIDEIMEKELTPRLVHCQDMDETVVEFQDIVRKMLLGRKD